MTSASVSVAGETIGAIDRGLLVFVAVERDDSQASAQRLLERVLSYRVFPDAEGKTNLSVKDISGGLLLVPQFTLAADTTKGTRPSFSSAAAPEEGRRLFEHLLEKARGLHADVGAGQFGVNMQVSLVNDGPVTFWLRSGKNRD